MTGQVPPHWIRAKSRALYRATHTTPTITLTDDNRWLIHLTTGRVDLKVWFRTGAPGGEAAWDSSTLTVDGTPVPYAVDEADLARIIADPDSHLALGAPDARGWAVLTDTPTDRAPKAVRASWAGLQALDQTALDPGPVVLRAGTMGPSRWAITVTSTTWEITLTWYRADGDRWRFDDITVIRDGEDISAQAHGDIYRALSLCTGYPVTPLPDRDAGSGPVTAGPGGGSRVRQNSVEARRHSVIRV